MSTKSLHTEGLTSLSGLAVICVGGTIYECALLQWGQMAEL